MFIGREKELQKLNSMYKSGRLEMVVVYGRRRVGKTTLISEFCKGKKTIFFAALESTADQNLEALSDAISYAEGSSARPVYKSFAGAFDKIREIASEERLILVIDEYPYLAQAERSISSLLQNYLDHQFKDTKLFVILCGSSMSFMENQVLGYQSPLYGRRTAQFKILPFDYRDTAEWFPRYTFEEKALMYGVTGGVPMYLEQMSPDKTVKENLLDAVFDANALLFEEPANLLKQELREPAVYNAILNAVAGGRTKMSEIASAAGIETGLASKYISNLISLGILKREVPVTEKNSRRPIYLIDDFFFRFWYAFVPQNMAAVLSGRISDSYEESIESRLSDYMGLVFEKMCRDFLVYHYKDMPFAIGEAGQWWGSDAKTRKQVQIDIVVTSADKRRCIAGSCKYRSKATGEDELNLLQSYAEVMNRFENCHYYLFSKSGFTDTVKKCDDVKLFEIGDLYIYS